MFMNYLKIALRQLKGNLLYSLINISGLAVGLACCLLILLFVRFELSFDTQYSNADRIYRISREYFPVDGARARIPASTNAPVGPALQEDFSQVEAFARIFGGNLVLGRDEISFIEPGLRMADAGLFRIFDFDWLAGDPDQALATPGGIVLTENLALKYFGRLDVLGESMRAQDAVDVTVTGVIADLPDNTHLDFSALFSISAVPPDILQQWNGFTDFYTYFLLEEGADVADIENSIAAFMDRHMGENASALSTLPIMPITDIHLHSRMDEEWKAPGSISTVYSFGAIAFGILLIACINFMSIATARSSQRAKEIGMRISLGARRGELIRQFLGESLLTASLAMVAAVVLVEMSMPAFKVFVGSYLSFSFAADLDLLLSLLGLTVFVALFAGSYPALYLSAFKPEGRSHLGQKRFALSQYAGGCAVCHCHCAGCFHYRDLPATATGGNHRPGFR